ncbi:MAG: ActD protein, partial [Myxococcales bacterium]|nr:ActD protein [Myxococcales bacterium]
SIDGSGVITWHLPIRGRSAVVLQPGSGVPLAESYELDDAPDHERFFFVTSPADFDLAEVEDAVRSWGTHEDLELDAPLRATVFTVDKGGAR